jgi:hypothetical protein
MLLPGGEDTADTPSTPAAPTAAAPAPEEPPPSEDLDLPTVTNAGFSDVWNSGGAGLEGSPVKIAARVYQDTGDSLLAYADPEQDELPVQVFAAGSSAGEDDYVLITGTLTGSDTYETVAGGEVDVITIDGTAVKAIPQARALELANPATGGTRKLNLTQTKGGFTVTLKSISWTDDATRLNVEITNNGSAAASLMAWESKIQQGSRQFGVDELDEGADALSEDIKPGVTEKGSITFERIARKRGTAYIEFDWLSENYDLDTEQPFAFTMTWKR